MITREAIIDAIQRMPEPYLGELYEIIKNFEVTPNVRLSPPGLMANLRNIKISGPVDFSQTVD